MGTEHTPPPRRWNDTAIDRLADSVDDTRNEIAVLRPALERIARMESALSTLLEAHRDERDSARKFRTETRDRFDRIDGAHEIAPSKSWITIVVAVIGLVGVVVAALISAYVALHAGAPR